MATRPSNTAQNTRCAIGASTLPPAVMVSITSDPESDEVQKKTITRMIPTIEVTVCSGRCDSIANSLSSTAASEISPDPRSIRLIAVPPKLVIQRTETSEGTSSTAIISSRTVRPRLTLAMNMPTKGDQEIHQAQ